jgi:hypothetical protein
MYGAGPAQFCYLSQIVWPGAAYFQLQFTSVKYSAALLVIPDHSNKNRNTTYTGNRK